MGDSDALICDTCSLYMLLRIVPPMLTDPAYRCYTTRGVRDEFVKGPVHFRMKYPWKAEMRKHLKHLGSTDSQSLGVQMHLEAIDIALLGKPEVNLSKTDKRVLACALEYGYVVVTEEREMMKFASESFASTFQGGMSALEVLNRWIEAGLVVWSEDLESVLCDWKSVGEKRQPQGAIVKYEILTGCKYSGS